MSSSPLCFTNIHMRNWKENLAVNQRTPRTLFQEPLHLICCLSACIAMPSLNCYQKITTVLILIHLRFSIWLWAHFLHKGDEWLSCLFATCCINDFHLAAINSSNPCLVDVAHQYRWFRAPFTQSVILSHPFSFPSFNIALVIDLATCQISKKCAQPAWHSRSHFAIPRCRSEMNTPIDIPADFRYEEARFAPSSSMDELPLVSFAYKNKIKPKKTPCNELSMQSILFCWKAHIM